MLKLIWNTTNISDAKGLLWGNYHKENSNIWIFQLLKKLNYKIIDHIDQIKSNDSLIIVDSNIEKKKSLYSKLSLLCSKLYLFHLGDEEGIIEAREVYAKCTFVWRTFCNNLYFNLDNVKCIPLGFKSGIENKENLLNIKRDKKWAFIGTPHKSSRQDLLFQLSKEKPNFVHKTQKFNDVNSINSNQMYTIFTKTIFLPSPNGFVHPETYRLYEALECGCIPIVEDSYNYYDRLFPKNPFLKINKWNDAKKIISNWNETEINTKQIACIEWWIKQKGDIKNSILKKIGQ